MYQIYSGFILTQCLLVLTFKDFAAKTRTLDTQTRAAEKMDHGVQRRLREGSYDKGFALFELISTRKYEK